MMMMKDLEVIDELYLLIQMYLWMILDYLYFEILILILRLIIENLLLLYEYYLSIVYLNLFEINNHIQLNYIQKKLMQQMKPKRKILFN